MRFCLGWISLAIAGLLFTSCGGGDGGGDSTDVRVPITDPENQPPVAVAVASVTWGEAPLRVELNAVGSSDPDGEIVSLLWDFGDGSGPESGEVASHVYSIAGDFECVLTVSDDKGAASSVTLVIVVLAASCPEFMAGVSTGNVESASVVEASGIAASRKNPGVLWVHNDSGDSARLFAMDVQGRHLGIYNVSPAGAYDWEDIAVGPGPVNAESYIYIGDIGDNAAARSHVVIYRVPEPEVKAEEAPATYTLTDAVRLEMAYPEGPSDAEALFVDSLTADLYIVTKRGDGKSRVYRYPAPQEPGQRTTMALVTTLAFGTTALPGSTLVTAGDLSPLGNWVLLKTYSRAFLWLRSGNEDLEATFARPACVAPVRSEPQGEALGFSADGDAYFTVSEGSHPPLHHYARLPQP